MSKKISVYELLGLIKDGKIKEGTYIKYYDRIWENDEKLYVCLKNIINKLDEGAIELNDQVEILEEDKPIIELINIDRWAEITYEQNWKLLTHDFNLNINTVVDKINEIIDYINKKENK